MHISSHFANTSLSFFPFGVKKLYPRGIKHLTNRFKSLLVTVAWGSKPNFFLVTEIAFWKKFRHRQRRARKFKFNLFDLEKCVFFVTTTESGKKLNLDMFQTFFPSKISYRKFFIKMSWIIYQNWTFVVTLWRLAVCINWRKWSERVTQKVTN